MSIFDEIKKAKVESKRVYVEGGEYGTEDYDFGWAYIGDLGDLLVNWDSGCTAGADEADLRIVDIR